MTTTTIADLANAGRKVANTDLQLMLRGEVIPAFLMDVGYVAWRRMTFDGDILAAEYVFQLPINMGEVRAAYLTDENGEFTIELKYVGDREEQLAEFQTTTTGIPSRFYFATGLGTQVTGANPGYLLLFDCPLSEDRRVRVIGYAGSITGDDYTNEYELDNMMPRHVQPALICGLRRLIYKQLYGSGDRRYNLENEEYARWVSRIAESRESTPSTRAVFVR